MTAAVDEAEAGPVLVADAVSKQFGGLLAVKQVDFQVAPREIVGLIGPNGAGKTTFFNCLTGLYKPTEGRVDLLGSQIPPKPRAVVVAGMARTFQNIRLFGNMTALENVMVGRYCRTTTGPFTSIIRGPKFKRDEAAVRVRSQELLDFVGLGHTTDHLARNLPYGDQRRLEIARAVGIQPKVLLLDEPNAGMNPSETQALLALIRRLRDELGITIVLVAHDIPLVMNLCDRIQVLNYGRLIAEGDPASVRANPDVIAAYLGQARHA